MSEFDEMLHELLPQHTFPILRQQPTFRAMIEAHLRATGSSVEESVATIFDALMEQARKGDSKAATVLLDRFFGKAAPAVDLGAGGMTLEALVLASMKMGRGLKTVDAPVLRSEPAGEAS